MEIIQRKIGYQDLGVTPDLTFTATTFYLPFYLTQSYENIGIYTDTNNPVTEVITGFTSFWNLSYDGTLQKDCKTTNKCLINVDNITPASFYNASDGILSVTITNQNTVDCPGPITINWTGPNGFTNSSSTNLGNLVSGNYTIKITDSECNRTFATYYVAQPGPLDSDIFVNNSQVNDTNGACAGSATVTATGGRPPYTYAWYSAGTTTPVLGTNNTLTNLCVGNYYVVVTDADGTQVTEFFNISQPPPLSGTVKSVINVDCSGNSGKIQVQGIGGYITNGYNYTLNGVTNNTGIFDSGITTPGTYNITISDNGGSTFILPVIIIQPITPISISLSGTKPTTDGFTDSSGAVYLPNGSATFTITGGQGPYIVSLESSVFSTAYVSSTVCSLPACTSSGGGNGGGSVYAGGYQQSTSGIVNFNNLPSGGYVLTVTSADGSCGTTYSFYLEHMYEFNNICIRQYNSSQFLAVTNPYTPWVVIQWNNSSTPTTCAFTPCGSGCVLSDAGSVGEEITVEIYVNASGGILSYKRIYKLV